MTTGRIPMPELERFRERLEDRSDTIAPPKDEVIEIPVALLVPAPWNARRFFSETEIGDLRNDIVQNGLIHPIVVRPLGSGFEVVVGERRFRAVRSAGLKNIRSSVRQLSDREARRMGLSENLQRTDLNRYEETIGWLDLLELNLSDHPEFKSFTNGKDSVQDATISVLRRYKHEIETVRHNVMPNHGKGDLHLIGTALEQSILETFSTDRMTWKSFVENRLPLLQLPADLLTHLRDGLEYTKALELAKLTDAEQRTAITADALQLGLPLTQLRSRVKALLSPTEPTTTQLPLEQRLQKLRVASRSTHALSPPQTKRVERLLSELERLLGIHVP